MNHPPPASRYQRTGLLAIEPHAFLELFFAPATRAVQCIGDVAVVDIVGPIEQFSGPCFDSYEDIRARVAAACTTECKAVALRVSSPGGDVLGCFETAAALRDACVAAGKPLYAYVEKATSAAYALVAGAQHISCSSVALVGNIGVINRREDLSLQNAAKGLRIEFTTSGARKAYGNPDLPLSPEEQASTQLIVDQTAQVFFEYVARMRPLLSAEQVKGFEAGIFVGESAVSNGLADQVESFEHLLARAAGAEMGSTMTAYEKARAALQEGAKGDDANAIACKRALASMVGEGGGDEEKKPEETEEKKPEGDKAADDSDENKAELPDDDKKRKAEAQALAASAASVAADASARDIALKALADVHTLKVREAEREAKAEREKLMASRPDFSPEMRAVLATADIATVKKMVETLPKATGTGGGLRASTEQASGTRGATQGTREDNSPHTTLDLDAAMGITGTKLGVSRRGNALIFGPQPVAAKSEGAAK